MSNNLSYHYHQTALVPDAAVEASLTLLHPYMHHLKDIIYQTDYTTTDGFICCPYDTVQRQTVISTAQSCVEQCAPLVLVIIGMGGSILGTLAVLHALYGNRAPIRWYAVDSIDPMVLQQTLYDVEQELIASNNVLTIITSKSGYTIETQINALFFIELLQRFYAASYHQYVVVITDVGSPLWQYGTDKKYTVLGIAPNIGGRFSVLSAVTTFVIACMDPHAVEVLHQGARSITSVCTDTTVENSAAIGASLMAYHYAQGVIIHDLFVWSPHMVSVGQWWRQLLAESIGKESATQNSHTRVGITPTVSVGTEDLHSVAQLYLEGPYNRMTTFVVVGDSDVPLIIPGRDNNQQKDTYTVEKILHTVHNAVYASYQAMHRPYAIIELPQKNAYYLGQLLQSKMIETIYLAHLLQVNPYGQPGVELYKKEIHKHITVPSLW